ncbi:VanZ family protein (plasmid) [Cetobacterium somerae]|uniref:VanZ family protein n=1 Tax=Cetobacterium somerae TaxID=188913 RepID=UPI002E7B14D8|nr:VanZ family protein [Cetobacterium somerae]WVJ02304.1 VanZ family protein [Cetobacterium somerae]
MRREKVFRVLSIIVMLFIFWFSHQDAKESARQSTYVKKQMNKVISKGVKFNIRKNAHFFIYMVLGMSLLLSRENAGKREILEIVGFVILYSISDEYHQSFMPGRAASFRDVCIDILGGISGILVVKMMFHTKNIDLYEKSIIK